MTSIKTPEALTCLEYFHAYILISADMYKFYDNY